MRVSSERRADEAVAAGALLALGTASRAGAASMARSCVNSMKLSLDTAALHGLCRNRTPSVCLLGQKTCCSEMSTFVLQDFLGLYVLCW